MLSKADKTQRIEKELDKNAWEGKIQCPQCRNTKVDVVNGLFLFHCPKCKTGFGASVDKQITKEEIQTEFDKLI